MTKLGALVACAGLPLLAMAGSAAAQGNPENGDVELSAGTQLKAETPAPAPERPATHVRSSASYSGGSTGDMRLALQVRMPAANIMTGGGATSDSALGGRLMPLVTPGLRLLDTRLFAGLGLGYAAFSTSDDDGDTVNSRSGFTLVPTVTYDLIDEREVAVGVGGMLSLGILGESSSENADANDDAFTWGLTVLGEVRAKPLASLGVGVDFGWSFTNTSPDTGNSTAAHGFVGMLVIEASTNI